MSIKLQKDCDINDPEEFMLWAAQSIPIFGTNCMSNIEPIARKISQHFHEAGYEHVSRLHAIANADGFIHVSQLKKQTKKFSRPYRGEQHPLNGAAVWVGMDEPEPEPVVIQDPVLLTNQERGAQIERLRYMGYRINEPEPEVDKAGVVHAEPEFDPAAHSVTEVCAYLRQCADAEEKRLVILAERNGKNRNGILKRFS